MNLEELADKRPAQPTAKCDVCGELAPLSKHWGGTMLCGNCDLDWRESPEATATAHIGFERLPAAPLPWDPSWTEEKRWVPGPFATKADWESAFAAWRKRREEERKARHG